MAQPGATWDGGIITWPKKKYKTSIINVIAPPVTEETLEVVDSSKRWYQEYKLKQGRYLQHQKYYIGLKMNFRTEIKRKWANKTRNCNEKCQSDESDGKENNGAVCIVIVGYGKTTNKINQDYGWLTCDVCGGYACPKCSPNGLDENNDTVINIHREILKLHLIKHWLSECKRIRTHNHLIVIRHSTIYPN